MALADLPPPDPPAAHARAPRLVLPLQPDLADPSLAPDLAAASTGRSALGISAARSEPQADA